MLSVASGPSDSWTCAGIGVALFEQEDPFWWTRTVKEDDERGEIRMTENKKKGSKGLIVGDVVEARRNAVIRNRGTPSNVDDQGGRGGYTDLEVLEVLDPARAARIRLRQARCVVARGDDRSFGSRDHIAVGEVANKYALVSKLRISVGDSG